MQYSISHYQVTALASERVYEVVVSGNCTFAPWKMTLMIAADGTILRTTADIPPFTCKHYSKMKFHSCAPLSSTYQKNPCPIATQSCGRIMIDTLVYMISNKILDRRDLKTTNTVVNTALQCLANKG